MTKNTPKLPANAEVETPESVSPSPPKLADKLARFMERMDKELAR